MYTQTANAPAPAYRHQDHQIEVAYSFSEYGEQPRWQNTNKVWLDILFVHPESEEPAHVRVAKSNLILCQPKEVIEAIVYREVRSFLSMPLTTYDYV